MKSISINNEQFYQMVNKGYVVVDVRSKGEDKLTGLSYKESINIPYPKIINNAQSFFPNKNSKIIFICNYGQRSGLSAKEYYKMGYENALVLSGGLYNLK